MKKILTFAIALVMVFALASTALAAGWDIVVDVPEMEDIGLDIDALGIKEEVVNDKFFNPNENTMMVVLDKTYPVVEDDPVGAVVTVTFPKAAKISEDMQEWIKNGQLKLTISASNVELYEEVTEYNDAVRPKAVVDNECEIVFGEGAITEKGLKLYFMVYGLTEETKKDAKIIATLGVYNEWDDNYFRWEVKGEDYLVAHGANAFQVFTDDGSVVFPVEGAAVEADETSKIDVTKPIKVVMNDKTYNVSKQVNNELAFEKDGVVYTSEDDEYEDLKAIFDEVFKVLGFTYEGVKYMSEEHFVEYFGTIMEYEVSKVWPSGYVVELSTVDPSIVPPQTGDNTSVVGFAMIVVALVAAVVLKKVRA